MVSTQHDELLRAKFTEREPTGERFRDLTDEVFGQLHVVRHAGFMGPFAAFLVQCDCGSEPFIVRGTTLTRLWEPRRDCGCSRKNTLTRKKEEKAERLAAKSPPKNIRFLTADGRTQSMSAWARELGVSRQRLHQRLQAQTIEEVLQTYDYH